MDITPSEFQTIVEWAQAIPLIKAVFLFGSRAKGTSRPDSDIDIVIVIDPPSGQTAKQVFEQNWLHWGSELQRNFYIEVDLLTLRGAETPRTTAAVEQHGIVVFERPAPSGG
jgi:predicted nucleotidyltransferase